MLKIFPLESFVLHRHFKTAHGVVYIELWVSVESFLEQNTLMQSYRTTCVSVITQDEVVP